MGLINTTTGEYIKVANSDEITNSEEYMFNVEEFLSKEHRDDDELRMKYHSQQERVSKAVAKEYTKRLNKLVIKPNQTFREAKLTAAYMAIKTVEKEKWDDCI